MIAKKHIPFLIVFIVFGLIFCSISLVNHYNFRTAAFDLGLFNNALWDYAHFRKADYVVAKHIFPNHLADHFSLVFVLFSPLIYLFGSYTLLIVQILAILFGGIGVYKLSNNKLNNEKISTLISIHFFCIWGIYSALTFDYHDNVIAAMLVPWIFLMLAQKKWGWSILLWGILLLTKENMALWAVFIALGLFFVTIKDKYTRWKYLLISLLSLIYFVVVIKLIIPYFGYENHGYHHFAYSALGGSLEEAFGFIINSPLKTIEILFTNHIENPIADGIKVELYTVFLLSGGIIVLIKPQYLIMLIPIFAQKMFSDDFGKWGINAQYSIEFAPIISITIVDFLVGIKNNRILYYILIIIAGTLTINITKSLHRTSKWYNKTNAQFYKSNHYTNDIDVKKMNHILNEIPADAAVSASYTLVPHLALRDFIYQFPYIYNADYIVLCTKNKFDYPIRGKALEDKISALRNSKEWQVITEDEQVLIFKKNSVFLND